MVNSLLDNNADLVKLKDKILQKRIIKETKNAINLDLTSFLKNLINSIHNIINTNSNILILVERITEIHPNINNETISNFLYLIYGYTNKVIGKT